jgi:hypothetical protein
VDYNPNRISLLVTNNGATNITLTNDPGIVTGEGVLLLGNGATMGLKLIDDGDSVASQWYAIGDAAGGLLSVWESLQTQIPTTEEE